MSENQARQKLLKSRGMKELREGRLLVQIEPSLLDTVRALAEKEGVSTGELTRYALQCAIDNLTDVRWDPKIT